MKPTVVMVTYNSRAVLEANLSLLYGQLIGELVVVDNASTDGSQALLDSWEAPFPVRIIANPSNEGFGAACNRGIQLAQSEQIVLINPDMRLYSGAIQELVTRAETDNWDILAPVTAHPQGVRVINAGREPTIARAWAQNLGLSALGFAQGINFYARDLVLDEVVPVDWVSFGFVLVRRKAFEAISGFSPTYFLYGEDFDFCHRARAVGCRVGLLGRTLANHALGGSSNSEATNVQWLRGERTYYRRNLASHSLSSALWSAAFVLGFTIRGLLAVAQGRGLTEVRTGLKLTAMLVGRTR